MQPLGVVAKYLLLLALVALAVRSYARAASLPPAEDAQNGYLPMAEAIGQGEPLLRRDGSPCATWPPGWPAILAILQNRHLAAIAVFAGTAAIVAHARGLWLLCLVIASNWTLIFWTARTTSEGAFVFFLTVACLGMEKRNVGLTTLGVAMACIVRYLGVALLPLGLVYLWRKGRQARIFYCALAPLPIALWAARNMMIYGYSGHFGPRRLPDLTLADAAQAIVGHVAVVGLGPFGRMEALHFPAVVVASCLMVAAWRAWRSPWLWAGLAITAITVYGASAAKIWFSARFAVPLVIPFLIYTWDGLIGRFTSNGPVASSLVGRHEQLRIDVPPQSGSSGEKKVNHGGRKECRDFTD